MRHKRLARSSGEPGVRKQDTGFRTDAVGRYFKLRDRTRVRLVGLVEDGKYVNLIEDQQPAMFFPLLQSPASWIWLVVRSSRDPQQLAAAMRSVLRDYRPWDGSGNSTVERRTRGNFVPLAHGDSIAGRAGHDGRDAFDHRRLRNGCLLGEQAAQGVGNSRGSRCATQGSVAGRAGTCALLKPGLVADWQSPEPRSSLATHRFPARSVISVISGGQLKRTGIITVPMPTLV